MENYEADRVGGKVILQDMESKGGDRCPGGAVQPERIQCIWGPSEVPGKPLAAAPGAAKRGPYTPGLPTRKTNLLAAAPDLLLDRLGVHDTYP